MSRIASTSDAGSVSGSGGGVPAGSITTSGLTMNTARILGRTTAAAGAIEEITVGAGLTLSAGSLAVAAAQTAIASITAPAGLTLTTTGTNALVLSVNGGVHNLTLGAFGGLSTDGGITSGGDIFLPGGGRFGYTSRSSLFADSDGTFRAVNNDGSAGVTLDFATDGVLKIRNRANNADAALTASGFSVGASAGVDAAVTSGGLVGKTMTFTKGILTSFA